MDAPDFRPLFWALFALGILAGLFLAGIVLGALTLAGVL
jgi:hypothetical protein